MAGPNGDEESVMENGSALSDHYQSIPPKSSTGSFSKAGSASSSASSREYDESDDLLSDYTSETTFFDDDKTPSTYNASKELWSYTCYKTEGKVHIFGEWIAKTKSYRYAVIGPDWPCVMMTYIVIVVPSVFVYIYLLHSLAEEIIFFLLFGVCIFGLTTVFIADPGLVRKYHHARSRHWTYCDHCESFRPPGTVHCSTCQVCVAEYDHHCPVRRDCFSLLYYWLMTFFGLTCFVTCFCHFCSGLASALDMAT